MIGRSPPRAHSLRLLRVRAVLRGPVELLGATIRLVLFLASLAALSVAVAWPLWWLALHQPRVFTAAALGVLGIAVLVAVALRVRRNARAAGGAAAYTRSRLLPFLGRMAALLASLAAAYLAVIFYVARVIWLAVLLSAAVVLAMGFLTRRRPGRNRRVDAPPGSTRSVP